MRRTKPLLAALVLLVPAGAVSERGVAGPSGGTVPVEVFFPRGSVGLRCDRVHAVARQVVAPAVLRESVKALLRGPTAVERRRGYGGWFSPRTAAMLRGVRLSRGVAFVDFHDFRRVIPNASSSCGSSMLLAQLDRTTTQFPSVHRAVYSFNGSRSAFYEWLQRSPP